MKTTGSFHKPCQAHRLVEARRCWSNPPRRSRYGNPVFASVLRLERGAGRQCKMTANDRPATEESPLDIEEVHRTTEPSRAAGVLPKELRHRGIDRHPTGQGNAVVPVSLKDVVVIFEDFGRRNRDRLLSDVQMKEPANVALGVVTRRLFFEAANHHHRSILSKKVILVRHQNPHPGILV